MAREETQIATQILRAGNFTQPCRYASPVMGDRGPSPLVKGRWPKARGDREGEYEREALILSRPRWRFAQSIVTPGEAQRSGFAGKRRNKGAGAVFAARRKRRQADFATTSRHGQSRSPPAGGETSPAGNGTGLLSPPHPPPSGAPSPLWGEGIRAAKGRPYGVGDPPRRAGEDTRPCADTETAPFPS